MHIDMTDRRAHGFKFLNIPLDPGIELPRSDLAAA